MGLCGEPAARPIEEARRVAEAAVDVAKANARFQRKRVSLAPVDPITTSWKSAFQKDPLEVPLDDKIQFLLKLNRAALETKGVSFVELVDAMGQRAQVPCDLGRLRASTSTWSAASPTSP